MSPIRHLVSISKYITRYVQCLVGTDLRWQTNGWYRKATIILVLNPTIISLRGIHWWLQRRSAKVDFVWLKNIQEEVILYWFRDCYREHHITSKPRSMSLSTCKLLSSFHFFLYSLILYRFLLFGSKSSVKFCQKNFHYRSFPTITGHGIEKVLPMKFEILGLEK